MSDTTDTNALIADLNAALAVQYRCVLAFGVAAGTLPGPEGVALGGHLRAIATDELMDAERLAARVASLGGTPTTDVGAFDVPADWRTGVDALAALQREALEKVVEAIPADADDTEGEATEHLLEHVTERKRNALELLERALR